MAVEQVHRETYRGIHITIEHASYPASVHGAPVVEGYAAHVPVPGHGYLSRYYATEQGALRAAKQKVDDHFAVEQPPLDDAASQIVVDVLATAAHLIRAVSRGNRALHKPMLERVAEHLGIRPGQFALNNGERHATREALQELAARGSVLSPPQQALLDRLQAWKDSADDA